MEMTVGIAASCLAEMIFEHQQSPGFAVPHRGQKLPPIVPAQVQAERWPDGLRGCKFSLMIASCKIFTAPRRFRRSEFRTRDQGKPSVSFFFRSHRLKVYPFQGRMIDLRFRREIPS
jgi:hypothetical protein